MIRPHVLIVLALGAVLGVQSVQAATTRTLVLPLRTTGVSDETASVSRELLVSSLQDLGTTVIARDSVQAGLPVGPDACDEPTCAAAIGRQIGAGQAIYGSLSRLGNSIIARLNVIRVDEAVPYYRDQLTATSEEDLGVVMRRFAEGIAAGKPNSNQASVESVTQAESQPAALRASRAGLGFRAGFLFPTGNSYGGVDRMTNLHLSYKYELKNFEIETSTLLGFSWGEDNFDWTILDIGASRIFGTKDFSPFLGASLGVHSVTVAKTVDYVDPFYGYTYSFSQSETKTAPTVDLVGGIMWLRTYDFEIVLELRAHYVFEKFDEVGGNGANGVMVTIGTSR